MGGVQIKVDSTRLQRALNAAEQRARHMKPAWQAVGEGMLLSIEDTFDAEGRPERWKPRKKAVSGKKILVRRNLLRRSITYRASSDGVVVGTNKKYAATHQFGRDFGRGSPIPARPFLVIQPEDEQMIAETIEDFIVGNLR